MSPLDIDRLVRHPLRIALALLAGLAAGAAQEGVAAQQADPDPAARPATSVVGRVVDAETDVPLAAVEVRLREVGRAEFSHADGSFHFTRLAPGTYTLIAQRIGYAPLEERIRVEEGRVTTVTLRMRPSALEVGAIVVTGIGRERGVQGTYQPTSVVRNAELRRMLTASIAATLAHEPGIAQQYNGPAATQPVVRGMGSDRVLVLEDGQRTGDLSTTAPDHAVSIDPAGAERVEVVRGPAGLLYGSNALGGVINVIREEVPRRLPHALTGRASMHGESVNDGVTGAVDALIPVRERFVVRGELNLRTAGDTRTPEGVLPSSDLRGHTVGGAVSWIPDWGFVGVAVRDYRLDYGVPGEFQGRLIPGAHPGGVDIEMRRRVGRFELGHFAGLGPFSAVEAEANVVAYLHDEIEGHIAGEEGEQRVYGARFDQLSAGASVVGRHDHELEMFRTEGAVGFATFYRDLLTFGRFPGSRSAREFNVAGYLYEEFSAEPLRLQVGARYDWTVVDPYSTDPIRVGDREISVRERRFGAFSGSVAALYEFAPGWTLGANLARAFRTPSIRELYSDGPHLADFSYDIGNPELRSEFGLGTDLFVRAALSGWNLEATVFRNAVRNFIYHSPTGELDPRFRRFPVFEARGDDAVFLGGDGRVQWEPVRRVVLDGRLGYVTARRLHDDNPLPSIPPLQGGVSVRYDGERFLASAGWRAAGAQNRVPRPIVSPADGEPRLPQTPTDGYHLFSAGAGVRFGHGDVFHSVTVQVDNLTDAIWREHLSRIKDVAPQPGRNVRLLYRVHF